MGELEERKDNPAKETLGELKVTSEKEPETFTLEQVQERERNARSDALAEAGRLRVANEAVIKVAQKAQERIGRMIRDQDDAELEAHKDEPERISAIRERQQRRIVESKLADTESELEVERTKTKEAQEVGVKHTKEQNAREVASRLNVNVQTLLKFTDGSKGAMEDLAKSLPKVGEKTPLIPDSGKTTGAGTLTVEHVKQMSPKEQFERASEIAKLPLGLD